MLSDKPFQYSSAMKAFKQAGWECSDLSRDQENQGERFKEQEEYENQLITTMKEEKEIPGVGFSVSFAVYDDGMASIGSHGIATDIATITTLLSYHPEILEEVQEIASYQLQKTQQTELPPDTYEFNESIISNSTFYADKQKEVIEILSDIKNGKIKTESIDPEYKRYLDSTLKDGIDQNSHSRNITLGDIENAVDIKAQQPSK